MLAVSANGVDGDRHAGPTLRAGPRQKGVARGTVLPNTRQLTLVSVEECATMARALGLPRLDFTWLAANVALEGVAALSALPAGVRLRFSGGVELRLHGENEPCARAGRVIADATGRPVSNTFARAAVGLRGVIASVERPGSLLLDEAVEVLTEE
jgi:MOSC domain-containing protein YiiM